MEALHSIIGTQVRPSETLDAPLCVELTSREGMARRRLRLP
jgi:hypothetical protein